MALLDGGRARPLAKSTRFSVLARGGQKESGSCKRSSITMRMLKGASRSDINANHVHSIQTFCRGDGKKDPQNHAADQLSYPLPTFKTRALK